MPMNPRTLRPSRGVPVFSEQGYARLWGLSNLQSKTISGVVETDTGQYAVKFGNQQPVLYSSGDAFCETNITDSSPNAHQITTNGGAVISTAQSKWGGASGYFDGDGNTFLSVNSPETVNNFAYDDFTVELWAFLETEQQNAGLVSSRTNGGGQEPNGWVVVLYGGNNNLQWHSQFAIILDAQTALPTQQWTHIAMVRHSGVLTAYVNGISVANAPDTTSYESTSVLNVGYDSAYTYGFNGYIDDLRIVKGAALYTANFTPPTSAPTAVSGTSLLLNFDAPAGGGTRAFEVYPCVERQTSLLLHFDGNFNDSSPNGLTVTASGGAATSTAQSKWGGSSAYFDGNGRYLSASVGVDWSGDWTIEMWYYRIGGGQGSVNTIVGAGPLSFSGPPGGLHLYDAGGGSLSLDDAINGAISGVTIPTATWTHIAIVRNAGQVSMFVDGSVQATQALTFADADAAIVLGGSPTGGFYSNSYIDEFRIVSGAALYTANFTPPTSPLEVVPYAVLPSGQFDGFDLSGNSLKAVRSEGVALEQSAGYTQTVYPYNYVPPGQEGGIVSNNSLSSQALDKFYDDLLAGSGSLTVSGNPGIDADDPTIATAKGYTVLGGVPPNTALLLHFDGNFTDSSPNGLTVTASGGASISTAQSKWGGASLYLDGSGFVQATHAALNPGHEDFTLEAWVRPTSITFNQVFSYRDGSNASLSFYDDGGSSRANYRYGAFDESAAGYVANQWHHIALVRNDGDVVLYLNGTSVASYSGDQAIDYATLTIGAVSASNTSERFVGYIDDVRVIIGAAIYTANFTPPTGPLGVYP